MTRLLKYIIIFTCTGAILSFLNNFILLELLEKNGCVPFYHGTIRPNFIEVVLFGLSPLLIYSVPNKLSFGFNKLPLTLGILGFCCGLSLIIGTYFAVMEWCVNVLPNMTLYMGNVGGFKWDFRQGYFLVAHLIGLIICLKVKRH